MSQEHERGEWGRLLSADFEARGLWGEERIDEGRLREGRERGIAEAREVHPHTMEELYPREHASCPGAHYTSSRLDAAWLREELQERACLVWVIKASGLGSVIPAGYCLVHTPSCEERYAYSRSPRGAGFAHILYVRDDDWPRMRAALDKARVPWRRGRPLHDDEAEWESRGA